VVAVSVAAFVAIAWPVALLLVIAGVAFANCHTADDWTSVVIVAIVVVLAIVSIAWGSARLAHDGVW